MPAHIALTAPSAAAATRRRTRAACVALRRLNCELPLLACPAHLLACRHLAHAQPLNSTPAI